MSTLIEWALSSGELGKLYPQPPLEFLNLKEISWDYFIGVVSLEHGSAERLRASTPLDKQKRNLDDIWKLVYPVFRVFEAQRYGWKDLKNKSRDKQLKQTQQSQDEDKQLPDGFFIANRIFDFALIYLMPLRPKGLGSKSKAVRDHEAMDCRKDLIHVQHLLEEVSKKFKAESRLPTRFCESIEDAMTKVQTAFNIFEISVSSNPIDEFNYQLLVEAIGKSETHSLIRALIKDLKAAGFDVPDKKWFDYLRRRKMQYEKPDPERSKAVFGTHLPSERMNDVYSESSARRLKKNRKSGDST
jgi:hypothetical protein